MFWRIEETMEDFKNDAADGGHISFAATIVATCTLHNFIRLHDLNILISLEVEQMEPRVGYNMYVKSRKESMNKVRKKITNEIW